MLSVFILMAAFSAGCRRDPYRVNVSSHRAEISVERLEQDLFTLAPDSISAAVPELIAKYGSFLSYFSYVINTGEVSDPTFGDYLTRFCTDRLNNEVYREVMKQFSDAGDIQKGLEEAFSHWRYYFPGKHVPRIYTCITGFNYSIIPGDSVIGIGLDSYLGAESEFYRRLQVQKYIAARMTRENIVPDAVHGWGQYHWELTSAGYEKDNVLTEIIHAGKLKYFEKCMLPGISDELLFGFTGSQMTFCRNNEEQMWTYLVENDLLFSTDQFTIRKLTGEAPFTSYFTNESPGRAAVWTGFRIVERYMKHNRNISLEALMSEKDVNRILEGARYNP